MSLFVCIILGITGHISGEAAWERGAPFWRYFTRCFGLGSWVRDPLGRALFLALWAVQILAACLWYLGGSESALWLLIGAMSGDVALSHLWLAIRFRGEPNPGLWTAAVLYVPLIAAAFVLFPFRPLEFAIGFAVFGGFWAGAWHLRFATPQRIGATIFGAVAFGGLFAVILLLVWLAWLLLSSAEGKIT